MYYIYIALILVILSIALRYYSAKRRIPQGAKEVPFVKGGIPFIGHGNQFAKNPLEFIRDAHNQYGDYFKIRIFGRDIVIVCDREACNEYFKSSEKKMSLYEILDDLYFSTGFSDDLTFFQTMINIVKKSVEVKYEKFAPKIMEEAEKMINRIKVQNNSELELKAEMSRFISNTSARCFIDIELTDEFYDILTDFSQLLNKIIVTTYFVPKWLITITANVVLKRYRQKMVKLLEPIIDVYIKDPSLKESKILHNAVNYVDQNGKKLTNDQIGDIVVCMLYISSENTALGLAHAMVDLSQNEKYWALVKEESEKYLDVGDVKSLFNSPILDACIMESARINSHLFAIMRKPKSGGEVLNGYYIGDAYSVALCEPILMRYEKAIEKFTNPDNYDPGRFLEPMNESKASNDIITWSSGVHICPGKMFALYELKAAMAMIVTTFNRFEIAKDKITELDFFSPAAFADRKAFVTFDKIC